MFSPIPLPSSSAPFLFSLTFLPPLNPCLPLLIPPALKSLARLPNSSSSCRVNASKILMGLVEVGPARAFFAVQTVLPLLCPETSSPARNCKCWVEDGESGGEGALSCKLEYQIGQGITDHSRSKVNPLLRPRLPARQRLAVVRLGIARHGRAMPSKIHHRNGHKGSACLIDTCIPAEGVCKVH